MRPPARGALIGAAARRRARPLVRSGADAAEAHVLDLEPVVDPVLGALTADAGLLDAAERRHLGRDQARVDPNDPALQRLGDAPDAADVPAVEVAAEPERGVVGARHALVLG